MDYGVVSRRVVLKDGLLISGCFLRCRRIVYPMPAIGGKYFVTSGVKCKIFTYGEVSLVCRFTTANGKRLFFRNRIEANLD